MDLNEINKVIENQTIDSIAENVIVKKLTKEVFFQILEDSGLAEKDLIKLVSKKKKNDYIPFHKFNFILKELHKKKKINIADSAIYLETDMFDSKEIFNCLNEENMYELRLSMANRNNISLMKTKTELFLNKIKNRKTGKA